MEYVTSTNNDSEIINAQEGYGKKLKIFVYLKDEKLSNEIKKKIKENCDYTSEENYETIFMQNAVYKSNDNTFLIFFCNPEHKKQGILKRLHINYSQGSDLIITDDKDFCNYCMNEGIDSKKIIDAKEFSLEMLLN
jgi:hypothetical protein